MADLTGEAWHNEQRRRSQDLIRVKNPTDKDYILIWENERFIVPSQFRDIGYGPGQRVMQRYLAEKYTREMVDRLIFSSADQQLEAKKEELQKRGATNIEYTANIDLMNVKGQRTDNPDLRQPLEDEIWVGLEEEFGVDREFIEDTPTPPPGTINPFARLADKKAPIQVKEPVPVAPPKAEELDPPDPSKPTHKAEKMKKPIQIA